MAKNKQQTSDEQDDREDLDEAARRFADKYAGQRAHENEDPFLPPDIVARVSVSSVRYTDTEKAVVKVKMLELLEGELDAANSWIRFGGERPTTCVYVCLPNYFQLANMASFYLSAMGEEPETHAVNDVDISDLADMYGRKQVLTGQELEVVTHLGQNQYGDPFTFVFWRPLGSDRDCVGIFKDKQQKAAERKKRYGKGR